MATPVPLPEDDATELTIQAWRVLESEKEALGLPNLRIQPAAEFMAEAEKHPTSIVERNLILDQAALLFTHLYPHLPFKSEIYHNPDPVKWMEKNLRPFVGRLSERDFHARMIDMFTLVCDPHTLYGLPSPYRGAVAFLPFQIRTYGDQTQHYVVTKLMKAQPDGSFGHPFFGTGAEIVTLAGQPVDDIMNRTADRLFGGNEAARLLRASIFSTVRPLTFCQPPFDDQLPHAVLQYRPAGSKEVRTIRIPWGVATGMGKITGIPSAAFSISSSTAALCACESMLHAPSQPVDTVPAGEPSEIPDVFEPGGLVGDRIGYLRIRSFTDGSNAPGTTDRLVAEFRRILERMDQTAPDGLVLDIRSNPGGDVQAAERMLQMLTPGRIEPARFHLANTPGMLGVLQNIRRDVANRAALSPTDDSKLTDAHVELGPWLGDADNVPLPHGERLTSGQPLTDRDAANDTGQVYQGRVILLVDSLTYSAGDIFAGGFQDHGIGRVMGWEGVTGGGGANLWSHSDLLARLGPDPGLPLAKLPRDATMSVAIRRSSRTGPFEGEPVEDVGVKTDVSYIATEFDDLLSGQPGMIRDAAEKLKSRPLHRVDVSGFTVNPDGSITGELRTINVDNLEFFVDGKAAAQIDVNGDGVHAFDVPSVGTDAPVKLRIEGTQQGKRKGETLTFLVAVRTVVLRAAVATATLDAIDPVTQSITGTDLP
ncbi:MAG: hypothetical protein C5B56_01845 [Proteobacteria bacterium]|nr:MAG: hypothetical protein C5B56_01845 [Pseudomonadota bacterium]